MLFVSEPIAQDVTAGANDPYGFDEHDAFDVVLRALRAVAHDGTASTLTVKLHPYEESDAWERLLAADDLAEGLSVGLAGANEDPTRWILWADLVVGIGSILLLEAAVFGRAVVSVQPGLLREDTFPPSRAGLGRTLTEAAEAEAKLVSLIRDPAERHGIAADSTAFVETLPADTTRPILTWIRSFGASRIRPEGR